MHRITSLNDLYPDYLQAFCLLKLLDSDSQSFDGTDRIMILNFTDGRLFLTIEEILAMNHPPFLMGYQKDKTAISKEEVLAAIKGEFGKQIWSKPNNPSTRMS